MDLILRNARLPNGSHADIGIKGGVIHVVEPHLAATAAQELPVDGRLVLPAFVNGQLHSCKVFWRRHLEPDTSLLRHADRFRAARRVKERYTPEDVERRAHEAVRLAILHGTCALRLFADIDGTTQLNAFLGVLAVKESLRTLLPIQLVAFPQDGVSHPETRRLMKEALELGADVVGGIPWVETSEAARSEHIDMCFELAQAYEVPLHFVADDTTDPNSRTVEAIARKALRYGLQGRVSVTQCTSLAFQDDAYAAMVTELLLKAEITVFSNTHVSLVTTEHTAEPYPRGITRVRQLLDAGVPVACAQDDIDNWYYPFGRNDMLEVAQFMAHAAGLSWGSDLERVLPMVTTTPARALCLDAYGLVPSCRANLVVLDAPDWHKALQYQALKRWVILSGVIVATSRLEQTINLPMKTLTTL